MSSPVVIEKVGTSFKVSNGTITLQGPNRTQLLAILDSLETNPATVTTPEARKKLEADLKKAGEVTRKKVETKKASRKDRVIALIKKKGEVTAADVIEALAEEGQTTAQWGYLLLTMYREKVLKRKKVEGIWTYLLRK